MTRKRVNTRFLAGFLAACGIGALLAACESTSTSSVPLGTVGHVTGFIGDVAGDEPQAVEVARQVLSAGGTATDAAVALDFTLAVTLPSRASLASGGVCLVYDHASQKTEVLDFTPKASATGAGSGNAPLAVPGNPKAMFALHSKHGRLMWEQLLAPAERLARDGAPISKTLGRDLDLAAGLLAKDPEAVRTFGRKGGGFLHEGDTLVQADLGVLIGRLRTTGPGDLYDGMLAPAVARRFSEAGQVSGSTISADDLRDYQPDWKDPVAVAFGDDSLNFAPSPASAGPLAAEMWTMLAADNRYRDAKGSTRLHLFGEVSMRAFADRSDWVQPNGDSKLAVNDIVADARLKDLMSSYSEAEHTPSSSLTPPPTAPLENPAATSFVVVDNEGSAVTCGLTMNNLFGLGRVARGTGIVAAAAPVKGSGVSALVPMLVVDKDGALIFAAGASGGTAAPAALITVALESMVVGRPLPIAISIKRVLHTGLPDVLVYEKGLAPETINELTGRKYKLFGLESLGLVNVVWCSKGLPKDSASCHAATDPRGSGGAYGSES